MAKAKTEAFNPTTSIRESLMRRSGGLACAATDHRKLTFGVSFPSLAFQWLIGHCSVIPCQRILTVAAPPKNLKSTVMVALITEYARLQGDGIYIDNEKGKTSSSMLESQLKQLNSADAERVMYVRSQSAEGWMEIVTDMVKLHREELYDAKKGERRPMLIVVDSLTGTGDDDSQAELLKEGSAEARGYPVQAAQVTRFLSALNLNGTLITLAFVQHLKEKIDQMGHGDKMKEKGAVQAMFDTSLGLRVAKGVEVRAASHPLFPNGKPVEGYTLWISTKNSCLGPDKNKLSVDCLWQYEADATGEAVQNMKFDWPGALGRLLCDMQYDKDNYADNKEELKAALKFTGKINGKDISCKELGLEDVDSHTFGKAIQEHPEVSERIRKFLRIVKYNDVQQADLIPYEAPGKKEKAK